MRHKGFCFIDYKMRQPKTPPAIANQLSGMTAERLAALFAHARPTDEKGRYLHWDELVHRTPPGDLSHEKWWAAIKFARAAQAQALPLRGASARSFTFCETPEMRAQLHMLDGEARGQLMTDEPVATRETADYYIVRSLIEEPFSSSVLEG
ncbi:MAG: hypothetical protein ACREVG_06365, partial [Burkholderiales bacterium]